jgi:hypothetical protein
MRLTVPMATFADFASFGWSEPKRALVLRDLAPTPPVIARQPAQIVLA